MSDQTKHITDESCQTPLLTQVQALPQDLEQRYIDYNNRLDKIIAELHELKRMLNPPIALDTNNPIHQLHQRIIEEHPILAGQFWQAIDRDGTVCRYGMEPYIGISSSEWECEGSVWGVDDVQLNGINWKDTLIKL